MSAEISLRVLDTMPQSPVVRKPATEQSKRPLIHSSRREETLFISPSHRFTSEQMTAIRNEGNVILSVTDERERIIDVAFDPYNLFIQGSVGESPERMMELVQLKDEKVRKRIEGVKASLVSADIWKKVIDKYNKIVCKLDRPYLFGYDDRLYSTITTETISSTNLRVIIGENDPRLGPRTNIQPPGPSGNIGAAVLLTTL